MIVDFVITVSVSVINFWRMFIVVVISSDNILTITFTGEVTSKVMVVVSISRSFWLIYVGLDTIPVRPYDEWSKSILGGVVTLNIM